MRGRSKLDAYFSPGARAEDLVPIDDPQAAPIDRSHGAVTRSETLWRDEPVAGGFFDPAIFGPLDGSAHRWGHIDVASGIEIAGTRVTRLPVPPIADRLPVVVEDPLARSRWHGRINDAWIALLQAIRTHDRFAQLGGPSQAAHVQQHFEDIVTLVRGGQGASHHEHEHGPLSHHEHEHGEHQPLDQYTMMPCPPVAPSRSLALLFLDEDRVLVQTTAGCRVFARANGAWSPTGLAWTPVGPLASSVHATVDRDGVHRNLVVFNAGQRDLWRRGAYPDAIAWPEDAPRSAPLAAYDLDARTWVMLVDDRFPAWVVDETDVAGADAHHLPTGHTHDLIAGSQRAAQLAQTRDGRFVLLAVARLGMYDDPPHATDDDTTDDDATDDDATNDDATDDDATDDDATDDDAADDAADDDAADDDAVDDAADNNAADDAGDDDDDATDDADDDTDDDATDDASFYERAHAFDPDAVDHALVIVEVATQRPFACLPDSPRELPLVELGGIGRDRRAGASVYAGPMGFRVVDRTGAVGDGTRWWLRIRGASVTAWSLAGQLAAIAGDELVILDVTPEGASVVSRAPLQVG